MHGASASNMMTVMFLVGITFDYRLLMSSEPIAATTPLAASRGRSTTRSEKHQPSAAAFITFLRSHNSGHWAEALLNNGYNLENLGRLTDADCRQLRVTNPREREKLLGLAGVAAQMMKIAASTPAATDDNHVAATVEDIPTSSPLHPDRDYTPPRKHTISAPEHVFTAALPTSNERCRQATIYVEHQTVDRMWPRPGSELTRSLALSTATPYAGSNTLYTLSGTRVREPIAPHAPPSANSFSATITGRRPKTGASLRMRPKGLPGRWRCTMHREMDTFGEAPLVPASPRTGPHATTPPPETDPAVHMASLGSPPTAVPRCNVHDHGRSAHYCGVCEQHIVNAAIEGQGQWQYQVKKTVVTGVNTEVPVMVWEPFEPIECLVLEHAVRQKKPRVKVGKHHADFPTMMWGPHRLRRVATTAVPFPTLKKTELTHPPPVDTTAEEALQEDLQESFRRLVMSEEERARFYIYHQQGHALDLVLGEIADMMAQLFAAQREALEAAEEAARQKVFDDNFELALDDLWAEAEKSVVDISLTDVNRASDGIVTKQQDIISKMEELGRDKVMLEEMAARDNLDKLLARFNAQVKALLKTRLQPVANTTLRCRFCRRLNCTFFHDPWQNHWRSRGPEYLPEELPVQVSRPIHRPPSASARRRRHYASAGQRKSVDDEEGPSTDDGDAAGSGTPAWQAQVLDRRPLRPRVDPPLDAPYVHPLGFANVAELVGKAKEIEYVEYLADKRRHHTDTRGTRTKHASIAATYRAPSLEASRTQHATDDVAAPFDFAAAGDAAVRDYLAKKRPVSASPRRPAFK
jgi:hypothetical protein